MSVRKVHWDFWGMWQKITLSDPTTQSYLLSFFFFFFILKQLASVGFEINPLFVDLCRFFFLYLIVYYIVLLLLLRWLAILCTSPVWGFSPRIVGSAHFQYIFLSSFMFWSDWRFGWNCSQKKITFTLSPIIPIY